MIRGPIIAVCGVIAVAVALIAIPHSGDHGEAVVTSDDRMGPVELFTKLHSAAALAAFCAHIGRVRKVKISPTGAAHPCCTEKELEMEKMRSGAGSTANFDWSSPSSWSGTKQAAAAHVAHKAASMGAMASPSASAWQIASPTQQAPQYAPQPQYAQPPPQYAFAPAYAQAPPQGQYWPHLLPGQQAPSPPQQMYAPPQGGYAPPPQGYAPQAAPLPISQNWGPHVGPLPAPQYAQQPYQPPPQQQMYQPPPQEYAPQQAPPQAYAPPPQQPGYNGPPLPR